MLSEIHTLENYCSAIQSITLPLDRIETQASRQCSVCWEMARLDQLDKQISGNKLFKLLPFLLKAQQQGIRQIVSFGGMHSNHLQALSAAGMRFGFEIIAIVRGYIHQPETPTIVALKQHNVTIQFADKKEYAKRYDKNYLYAVQKQYPNALIVPEGGSGELGVEGAKMIAQLLSRVIAKNEPCFIAASMGTGTTFLGLLTANMFSSQQTLLGISALNHAQLLQQEVNDYVRSAAHELPQWQLNNEYSFGGFAKMTEELALFIRTFEYEQKIPLDPVYTAKLCFAIEQKIRSGEIPEGSRVITLHTGGLQGRIGMQPILEKYYKKFDVEAVVNHA